MTRVEHHRFRRSLLRHHATPLSRTRIEIDEPMSKPDQWRVLGPDRVGNDTTELRGIDGEAYVFRPWPASRCIGTVVALIVIVVPEGSNR